MDFVLLGLFEMIMKLIETFITYMGILTYKNSYKYITYLIFCLHKIAIPCEALLENIFSFLKKNYDSKIVYQTLSCYFQPSATWMMHHSRRYLLQKRKAIYFMLIFYRKLVPSADVARIFPSLPPYFFIKCIPFFFCHHKKEENRNSKNFSKPFLMTIKERKSKGQKVFNEKDKKYPLNIWLGSRLKKEMLLFLFVVENKSI